MSRSHFGQPLKLTLDRIVEREDVNPLAVLDVVAGVDGGNVSELDAQVVASDCRGTKRVNLDCCANSANSELTLVDLDLSLVDVLRREDNQDCDGREDACQLVHSRARVRLIARAGRSSASPAPQPHKYTSHIPPDRSL